MDLSFSHLGKGSIAVDEGETTLKGKKNSNNWIISSKVLGSICNYETHVGTNAYIHFTFYRLVALTA